MAQINRRDLPPPQSPFVDDKTFNLSYDGYQFLLSLLAVAASTPVSVASALTATGANQATALQLASQWNEIDTVPGGTGVLLQALQPGQSQSVFNEGANALNVYPPPGSRIDALLVNIAFQILPAGRQTFDFISATQIRS